MKNIIFSLLYSLGIQNILCKYRIKNKEITVLMFHRVSNNYDRLWPPMPIKTFEFLMKEISKKTYVIPLEKIYELEKYPDKPLVALSFDDGYIDFYENALPILKQYNLPAHHNICPNLIDNQRIPWTQALNLFLQTNPDKTIKLPDKTSFKIENNINENTFIKICNELYKIDEEERNKWIDTLQIQMIINIIRIFADNTGICFIDNFF
ncbi:unnamed protein product [marine sediment metagenome]|uniref:NodB homology domain-containing protein n=1 Tax=marine sediment metagenome TaxID=412755 RepID=X1MSH9_9ZZZZ